MSVLTKSQLTTEINTQFPDNTSGQITPARLRTVTQDIVDSYLDANGAATSAANLLFAGPATGAAAVPTFRSQVVADLPSLAANTVLINNTSGAATPVAGTVAQFKDMAGDMSLSITDPAYGADPTFTNDSTTAIQNAINAITTGGTLIIPAGYFKVSSAITITKPMRIIAANYFDGSNANITTTSGSATIFAIRSNYVTIEGIYFNRQGGGPTGTCIAVGDDGTTYTNFRIYNNSIVNHAVGIKITNGALYHISRNLITANIGISIENQNAADTGTGDIDDNIIDTIAATTAAGTYNIYHKSGGDVRIVNNKFLHGQYGYYMEWALGVSANLVLANNSIEGQGTNSIYLKPTISFTRVNIVGNTSLQTFLLVDNAAAGTITDLVVVGNSTQQTGAVVGFDIGKVTNCIIAGNAVDGAAAGTAYNIRNGSTNTRVYFGTENVATLIADAGTASKIPTGTGNSVYATSPTLVTPVLGAATGTSVSVTAGYTARSATAVPAANTGTAILTGYSSGIGVYAVSGGAPTFTAPKGSICIRDDGSSSTTRAYIATDSAGSWTSITTAT